MEKAFTWTIVQVNTVEFLSTSCYPIECRKSPVCRYTYFTLFWSYYGDKNLSDTKTFLGGFTMPLVSMKEMLNKALEGKYAVGQFNMNNLEWTQAILAAAEEEKSPVILGVSEGAARHMTGFKTVVAMVKALIEEMNITVPVAIHLDHGSSFEKCKEAIDAGFTSVMIDASHHPFEENVETTKQVVEYAHARNVSVEAELGTVGGQEDDVIAEGVIYADPAECKHLVEATGIDCLARL